VLNSAQIQHSEKVPSAPDLMLIEKEETAPTEDEIAAFRDGIFALRTRRFGTVAEIMIAKLTGAGKSRNNHHDLFDTTDENRIEVKFATVSSSHNAVITEENLFSAIADAAKPRSISFSEWQKSQFQCNIQQIKTIEFEELFYGLFFHDRILIFHAKASDLLSDKKIAYSNKQHKGNEGEGQFSLRPLSLQHHLDNYLVRDLTYAELIVLLKASKTSC